MTPYVKNVFGFYIKVVFSIRLDIKPLATSHMPGSFSSALISESQYLDRQ